MPFREAFDCLWCGRSWRPGGPGDLEGWAQLCPDCLGRAGENPFLRARLRAALAERAGAVPGEGAGRLAPAPRAAGGEPGVPDDDWYLRRGRYSHGPIHDAAWQAELDAAGRWLDGLPIRGEIVELQAGTGWWSPLLAEKGELSVYDADGDRLDRARDRLLAHGLRAHLHVRDPWAPPDRPVDALFIAFWLGRVPRGRLDPFLRLARGWLRPGGLFAAIEALPDPRSGAAAGVSPDEDGSDAGGGDPAGPTGAASLAVPQEAAADAGAIVYTPEELRVGLLRAGFGAAEVSVTGRFFALLQAVS